MTTPSNAQICPAPSSQATLQLFCFPYAGGSSLTFRGWSERLLPSVAVCPVELPGRADYLDHINGGLWHYGDDSTPPVKTTFFAGTYYKHSLAMAAARAVLQYLKSAGPALQEQSNQHTTTFTQTLNTYFAAEQVPIRLANFGSMFNAVPADTDSAAGNPGENLDLFSYHLIDRGVFIRSGGGLLSIAHTDEDLDFIIQAVRDTVEELRQGGFLPPTSHPRQKPHS